MDTTSALTSTNPGRADSLAQRTDNLAQSAHRTVDDVTGRLSGAAHRAVDSAAGAASTATEWASSLPDQAKSAQARSARPRARPFAPARWPRSPARWSRAIFLAASRGSERTRLENTMPRAVARGTRRSRTPTALDLLKQDHAEVSKLFKQFERYRKDDDSAGMQACAQAACRALEIHAQIEEEIFYPALRESADAADALDEADVEHSHIKELVGQVGGSDPGDEHFEARVKVLSEYVRHHVEEEENDVCEGAESDCDSRRLASGSRRGRRSSEATKRTLSSPCLQAAGPPARATGNEPRDSALGRGRRGFCAGRPSGQAVRPPVIEAAWQPCSSIMAVAPPYKELRVRHRATVPPAQVRADEEVESLKEQARSTREEARMVLPGIQALFGFQLIAVFNRPFFELARGSCVLHRHRYRTDHGARRPPPAHPSDRDFRRLGPACGARHRMGDGRTAARHRVRRLSGRRDDLGKPGARRSPRRRRVRSPVLAFVCAPSARAPSA